MIEAVWYELHTNYPNPFHPQLDLLKNSDIIIRSEVDTDSPGLILADRVRIVTVDETQEIFNTISNQVDRSYGVRISDRNGTQVEDYLKDWVIVREELRYDHRSKTTTIVAMDPLALLKDLDAGTSVWRSTFDPPPYTFTRLDNFFYEVFTACGISAVQFNESVSIEGYGLEQLYIIRDDDPNDSDEYKTYAFEGQTAWDVVNQVCAVLGLIVRVELINGVNTGIVRSWSSLVAQVTPEIAASEVVDGPVELAKGQVSAIQRLIIRTTAINQHLWEVPPSPFPTEIWTDVGAKYAKSEKTLDRDLRLIDLIGYRTSSTSYVFPRIATARYAKTALWAWMAMLRNRMADITYYGLDYRLLGRYSIASLPGTTYPHAHMLMVTCEKNISQKTTSGRFVELAV